MAQKFLTRGVRQIELISKNSINAFWRDGRFLLALAAGPAVWFILSATGGAVNFARLPLAQYFLPVVLYPVLEEWIFRANLLPIIRQKFPRNIAASPVTAANLLTSLIFAGLHLFSHSPLWALSVLFPSLVFGWAMERYKTLAAPVVLHVFYNAGYFLLFA